MAVTPPRIPLPSPHCTNSLFQQKNPSPQFFILHGNRSYHDQVPQFRLPSGSATGLPPGNNGGSPRRASLLAVHVCWLNRRLRWAHGNVPCWYCQDPYASPGLLPHHIGGCTPRAPFRPQIRRTPGLIPGNRGHGTGGWSGPCRLLLCLRSLQEVLFGWGSE